MFLCHTLCEVGATRAIDALRSVHRFLVRNPEEVVVLSIQDETSAADTASVKLLWMGIGGDDPSIETHKQLRAYLDSRGVKYTYVEVPNERHWWPLWHRHFAEFAQLIFK